MSVERELLESCLDEFQYQSFPCTEPVAWMYDWNIKGEEEYGETRYDCLTRAEAIINKRAITNIRPLYESPPKREPLSDEEIFKLDDEVSWFADSHTFSAVMRLIRAVEKAHGIGGEE
jgi:hypothetical protein